MSAFFEDFPNFTQKASNFSVSYCTAVKCNIFTERVHPGEYIQLISCNYLLQFFLMMFFKLVIFGIFCCFLSQVNFAPGSIFSIYFWQFPITWSPRKKKSYTQPPSNVGKPRRFPSRSQYFHLGPPQLCTPGHFGFHPLCWKMHFLAFSRNFFENSINAIAHISQKHAVLGPYSWK